MTQYIHIRTLFKNLCVIQILCFQNKIGSIVFFYYTVIKIIIWFAVRPIKMQKVLLVGCCSYVKFVLYIVTKNSASRLFSFVHIMLSLSIRLLFHLKLYDFKINIYNKYKMCILFLYLIIFIDNNYFIKIYEYKYKFDTNPISYLFTVTTIVY